LSKFVLHLNRYKYCIPIKLLVPNYLTGTHMVRKKEGRIQTTKFKRQETNDRDDEIQARYHFLLIEDSMWQCKLGAEVSNVGIKTTASGCVSPASSPACPAADGGRNVWSPRLAEDARWGGASNSVIRLFQSRVALRTPCRSKSMIS